MQDAVRRRLTKIWPRAVLPGAMEISAFQWQFGMHHRRLGEKIGKKKPLTFCSTLPSEGI